MKKVSELASFFTPDHSMFSSADDLQHLKYLNISKCEKLDDWVFERIALLPSLLVLDVSGCPLVTEGGLGSLHRVEYATFAAKAVFQELCPCPFLSKEPLQEILSENNSNLLFCYLHKKLVLAFKQVLSRATQSQNCSTNIRVRDCATVQTQH